MFLYNILDFFKNSLQKLVAIVIICLITNLYALYLNLTYPDIHLVNLNYCLIIYFLLLLLLILFSIN